MGRLQVPLSSSNAGTFLLNGLGQDRPDGLNLTTSLLFTQQETELGLPSPDHDTADFN